MWHIDRLTRSPRELEDAIDLADRQGITGAPAARRGDLPPPAGMRPVGRSRRATPPHQATACNSSPAHPVVTCWTGTGGIGDDAGTARSIRYEGVPRVPASGPWGGHDREVARSPSRRLGR
ncbi:hypothetical protein ACWDR0_05095 [Streptomyces sp. NPDC003691]